MATIQIKDLDQNQELDRNAMKKITGGMAGGWQQQEQFQSLLLAPPSSQVLFDPPAAFDQKPY